MKIQLQTPVRFGETYRVQGEQHFQKADALRDIFRRHDIEAESLAVSEPTTPAAYVVTGPERTAYRKSPDSQMAEIEEQTAALRGKSNRNPLTLLQRVKLQAWTVSLYARHLIPGVTKHQERQREALLERLQQDPVDIQLTQAGSTYQIQSASRLTDELRMVLQDT